MSQMVRPAPPVNLKAEDRVHFEHHFTIDLTPASIRRSGPGTWLSTPQVLFDRLGRADAATITYANEQRLLGRRYYWTRRLLQKSRRLAVPAVLVTDRHSRNYFHWHTEALPNLAHFLGSAEARGDWQLLIPATAAAMPYVQQTLPLFVPDSRRLLFAEEGCAYSAPAFIHCRKALPFGHPDPVQLPAAVQHFNQALPPREAAATRKIYLRRNGAAGSKRSLTNEAEVMQLLEGYGYECLDFDALPYYEQIALCRQTRVLMGIHGAGLANMMFMPQGAKLFEFKNRRDINYFFFMAGVCGLDYHYQACDSEKRVPDHIGHLRVDVALLKADIERYRLY